MTYLINLENRGKSESDKDNFLYRKDNIYVMDNHRLALWCWFQEISKDERYNLIHIDAHPDMSDSALNNFDKDMWTISLEDYRSLKQESINSFLIRWDNYLKIFLTKYNNNVAETFSTTYKIGSKEELSKEVSPFYLTKFLAEIFNEKKYVNEHKWIVNIDLDYFVTSQPEKVIMFSDEFMSSIVDSIKTGIDKKLIRVLTIALSPECCGSWEKAQNVLNYFRPIIDLDLREIP